jgi:hypothetical protein
MAVWSVIYEHCLYFSVESLAAMFTSGGMNVVRLAECFGGQFLEIEAVPSRGASSPSARHSMDLHDLTECVTSFAARYCSIRQQWQVRLQAFARTKAKVAAWGAGARTIGLFNMLGIVDEIPYVVDINPRKHGTFLAGTGQAIVSPEFLREYRPTVVVVMNSIYTDEIGAHVERLGLSVEFVQA